MKLSKKLFGSSGREINKLKPTVEKIKAEEVSVSKLSDE